MEIEKTLTNTLIRRIRSVCCARAASRHTMAASLPSVAMNSRRRMRIAM